MGSLGVPLQVPGANEPLAAAVNRAALLLSGLARVVEAEQGVRTGLADLQTGDADRYREQAPNLGEGPGEGAAEGTVRPHSAHSHARTCSTTITGIEAIRQSDAS